MAAVVTGAMAYRELGMDEEAIKWCDDGLAIDTENQTLLAVKCKSAVKKAKQSSKQKTNLKTEIGNREIGNGENEASTSLALGVKGIRKGKITEGISYFNQFLAISEELGDSNIKRLASYALCGVYFGFSEGCRLFRDNEQAADVMICKEICFKYQIRVLHSNVYRDTGDFGRAIKFYKGNLAACKEVGDRVGEVRAYLDLGETYFLKGKDEVKSAKYMRQAMSYYQTSLDVSKEIGDKALEGKAYLYIGKVHQHLGDKQQTKDHYNKSLVISKETGDSKAEKDALALLLPALLSLTDLKQAMELSKQLLTVCIESEDLKIETVLHAINACGHCLSMSGFFSDAVSIYQFVVECNNQSRIRLTDTSKISVRQKIRSAYDLLWYVLLNLHRTEEALLTVEKGREQALAYLMASQYGFEARQRDCVSQKGTSSELLTCAPSNTVFLAVSQNHVYVWLLQDGEYVKFSQECLHRQLFEVDRSFITKIYEEIGVPRCVQCEDRSLDALRRKDGLTEQQPTDSTLLVLEKHLDEMRGDGEKESQSPSPVDKKRLSALYDAVVVPVIRHLRGNEIVIVPDGPLFMVPFAALQDDNSRYLCESFRIRVVPSLTCLKMIMDAPPDHHCKSGALIVGDPWVQEVVNIFGKPKLTQLPAARKEADMVATIVKSSPLIGSDATKEEVLKRLNSVALIHLAAHGDNKRGEIALAPNVSRTFKIPREEDFLLTMRDVLSVGVRARLVVLSCCHSGRGEIKDEGVVGIAQAFLGAGARSVLVSLWKLEDEATLEFMRVFYEHLVEGKKASEALNCATNYMRKSPYFGEIRLWAPFVLIGDDVTLKCFKGDLNVLGKVR